MPPSLPPRRSARRPALAALVLAAAVLGACDRGDARGDAREADRDALRDAAARAAALATGGDTAGAARAARDSARTRVGLGVGSGAGLARGGDPALGPGDVRVVSTDGALVLALVGDTVRMRLGDSVVTKVRHEMDAGADSAAGFGGFISRTVKGAVGGAIAEASRFAVRVPVAEVRELRYEDGELRFGSERKGGTRSSARFAPDDAARFIAAVRARQRALGVAPAGG